MPPYQGGGDMIASVSFEHTTYNKLPYKFEAGHAEHRGNYRSGPRQSITWRRTGWTTLRGTSRTCCKYATERVSEIPGVRIIGTSP